MYMMMVCAFICADYAGEEEEPPTKKKTAPAADDKDSKDYDYGQSSKNNTLFFQFNVFVSLFVYSFLFL